MYATLEIFYIMFSLFECFGDAGDCGELESLTLSEHGTRMTSIAHHPHFLGIYMDFIALNKTSIYGTLPPSAELAY